ncbi:MAG: ribosome silencing factor [Planctomycetes bacterium]|nr:ribosome silencing factor [Planctomycetota bacterium]
MPISNGSPDRSSTRLAHEIGDLIIDKKGEDLVVIDVERVTSLADLIVIATGRSKRQVLAMAEEIHFFAKRSGITVVSEEGREQGWWVLVDFGDVVVHIMQDEARAYYDLERLWGDGEVVRRVSGDGEGLTTGD